MSSHPVPSLWWKNPYCYYCGKKVVKADKRPKPSASDVGTVEHIPPKWITRLAGWDGECRTVLACYACNSRENKRVQELFPSYFIQLWNKGSLPKGRKMILP